MSRVLASGQIFEVEAYEGDPDAFGQALARAKSEHGHALCLCTSPNPQLVIRRIRKPAGDRFFLATWPGKGVGHAPSCRFHHSEDEYQAAHARRLAAVQQTEDGFIIRPEFTLSRVTAAPDEGTQRPGREAAPAAAGGQRVQRDTLSLLATLEYLWRTAGLNQYIPGSVRRWPEIVQRLATVLEQGRLGVHALSDITYLVPPYREADKQAQAQRLAALVRRFQRTPELTPAFLVLGEVREIQHSGKALLTHLRHHGQPLFMFASLGQALAQRYPIAEAQLVQAARQPQDVQGRVVGLFLVEVTDQGRLWARDAALLTCSREYLPCDSSYEVLLANVLSQAGRVFVKPMALDLDADVLPDFVLQDLRPPLPMEVWGMNTPEYNAHKALKRERYRREGGSLWEWEAWRQPQPPDLPAPNSKAQSLPGGLP